MRGLDVRRTLVLLALVLAGCGDTPPSHLNIVLISIDTLRADHVGLYGYERGTTPRLDALGAESLVFERAYSSASHTLPAHVSLLTGVEPYHHGVITSDDALPAEISTLARLLSEAGYQTGGFVNSGYLHKKFGLARGFDVYDFAHNQQLRESIQGPSFGRTAEETNRAIERWLDTAETNRPLFLFAHYYDVHSDWGRLAYEAPAEQRARFELPRPRSRQLDPGEEESASTHLQSLNRERVELGLAERDWLRSLYDAGIAYTDGQVGALLDALADRGWLEQSLVIVTSDHGEEFQEHGLLLHEQVYEELMRVPLIIRLPPERTTSGPRTGRIEALVRHVDLLPSVLEWVGLPVPDGLAGRSLLPLVAGRDAGPRIAVLQNQRSSQIGVSDGRAKLVIDTSTERTQLFDLERDPGETIDRSDGAEAEIRRLQAQRRQHLARAPRRPVAPSVPVDPVVAESLRALGYTEGQGDSSARRE